MTFAIRKALPTDIQALSHLARQMDTLHAQLSPDFFRVPTKVAPLRRFFAPGPDAANQALFVAEKPDGEVVGMVNVRVYDTPAQPEMVPLRRGHIEELVVDQGYRRQGLGRALMEAAANWSQRRGAEQLLLTVWEGNRSAEAFYQGLGYQPISRVLGLKL